LIHIESEDEESASKRLYYRLVVKPACRRAHRILTVSEYSRSRILAWSGVPEERVVNVGNGVAAPFVAEGPRYTPGFPYLLHTGNARPHKNLRRLFDAFRLLSHPDLRLVLAGCSSSAVAPMLADAGIADRTVIIPSPADDQLASIYRGATLVVVPSLIEGFGLAALEAMACGAPLVASETSSLPEVVGDAAELIDPLDSLGMAETLSRLLGQPSRREFMSVRGIARAREFSWDCVAARTRAVLEDAIETATHRRLQS
jgi:glycosyltransferase involved in cell wall biosynthesis